MNIKLKNFIGAELKLIKNPQVLEFGVREGASTKFFLKNIKKGKLISVDINNYKDLFKNEKWIFVKSRDDNFDKINRFIKKKQDIIYLDTNHTADHVEKIIYLYFKKLKINGLFVIDDTFWLPYCKSEYRDNEWIEINNRETFQTLIEIYKSNKDIIDMTFSIQESGICKIVKKKDLELKPKEEIISRKYYIKNIFRLIKKLFFQK
jgi:predicted O-methyltransferase YrrM